MLISLFHVEIGVLYFIALVPIIAVMKKVAEFPQGHNFADFLLVAMILGWFIKSSKENKPFFIKSPLNRVVILAIIGSIVSLIWGYVANDFSSAIGLVRLVTWKNYIILPILYFIALNTIEKEDMVRWVVICVCFGMIAMVFNFYSTFRWMNVVHYSHDIRIEGPFTHLGPNEMGNFFTQYFFLLFGISYFVDDRKLKIFILFVCGCCLYPILYSYSRGSYIAFVVGSIAIGFLKDRRILLLLVCLLLLYRVVLPVSVVERVDMTFLNKNEISEDINRRSAFNVGGSTIEVTGRKELWGKANVYFKERPIMGMGFDSFRHLVGAITHSLFYQILCEQGLVGMMIFIVFTIMVFRQSHHLYRNSSSRLGQGVGLGFLTCEIVFLTGSITSDVSLYYNLMAIYWLFLGIVAGFNIDGYIKS